MGDIGGKKGDSRSQTKNPFVANHLSRKIDKLNTKEEKEIIVTYLSYYQNSKAPSLCRDDQTHSTRLRRR